MFDPQLGRDLVSSDSAAAHQSSDSHIGPTARSGSLIVGNSCHRCCAGQAVVIGQLDSVVPTKSDLS